jgi:protein-S-isoprenylcysteine O-methyltransferase Ste14
MEIVDIVPLSSFLILLILIITKLILLRNKGIQVSSKSKDFQIKKIILYPIFTLIIIVFIMEISNPVLPKLKSFLSPMLSATLVDFKFIKIVGLFFIVFALICMSFTLIHFNKSLRFGINSNNLGKLITTGIFSISRNPFFVSLELYFVGILIVIPSLFFIVFALFAIISIHLFILKEEKFMKANYGEEYKKYANKVRRYF